MRLRAPETEHPPEWERTHAQIRRTLRDEVPDVLRTLHHRPRLFGDPFSCWVEAVLRGPSRWSEGERELMAAYVSRSNRYEFCTRAHSAVASLLLGSAVVEETLESCEDAPSDAMRATLSFLEKLTLVPWSIAGEDVELAVQSGVSPQALREAVEVASAFNVINRIGNALGWEQQSEDSLNASAQALVDRGYVQQPAAAARVRSSMPVTTQIGEST
jgi:uncharacterized peroxidase-related enzyme